MCLRQTRLSGVYTGRRIAEISGWYELDNWQKGYAILDLSIEKVIGKRWRLFAKAANLLDAATRIYVKGALTGVPEQTEEGKTVIENRTNGSAYLLGLQFRVK